MYTCVCVYVSYMCIKLVASKFFLQNYWLAQLKRSGIAAVDSYFIRADQFAGIDKPHGICTHLFGRCCLVFSIKVYIRKVIYTVITLIMLIVFRRTELPRT